MTRHDRRYLVNQIDEQATVIEELESKLDKILDIVAPPEEASVIAKPTQHKLIEENEALIDFAESIRRQIDAVLNVYTHDDEKGKVEHESVGKRVEQ